MPPKESNIFKYIDQDAIVRFGGNPMLSQFQWKEALVDTIKVITKAQVSNLQNIENTPGEDHKEWTASSCKN